jgi:NADH:ubiquinone oxidoreductase subunit 2 (subunit N)
MHKKSSSGRPERIIKYFLVQALGSILLLVSLIADKSLSAHHSPQHVASLAMLLKMGAAPIHQWLPRVSEGLP